MNNQKGFANMVLITLVVVLAGVAGYFTLNNRLSDSNTPCQSSDFCKSTPFVSSGHGWVPGCVNVLLAGGTGREQTKSLLRQLKLEEPAALNEEIKPYGAFVPTLEVIVSDFEQTVALLKEDPAVIDVQLHFRSLNPADYGSNYIYILFADSMTPSQGYKLLTETYKLRVNGNINSIIPDGVTLRLKVSRWSESSIVKALRTSPIVQYAIQCPVHGPDRAI